MLLGVNNININIYLGEHCKAIKPIYEELAIRHKSNKDLLIAEIDATENEVEEADVNEYPSIRFWPGKKKHKGIDLADYAYYNRTLWGFEHFVKNFASFEFTLTTGDDYFEKAKEPPVGKRRIFTKKDKTEL
ncbi:MAG: thioredoxin domain-containing protein [archaeon]|nr:thioredoxin domain-containing protein [archaeon]